MKLNHKYRNLTAVALLLGMLLASLDQVIVATSVPQIAAELGDLQHYAWVFSAYMIAELLGMPIFGKLSDMYGRKKFVIAALLMFIGGSMLCGTATSMGTLIASRSLQGLGAGAIMPIAFAIVFEIYPPELRNRMQSLMSAVYAISSVMGPIIGAVFTDYLDWRWIFYVNLPLGIVSLVLLLRFYREDRVLHKQTIDWIGLVLLFGSILSLLFLFELGGKTYAWNSLPPLGLALLFVVLFAGFLQVERSKPEPFIPLRLFRNRLFAISQTVGFFQGLVMMAAFTFIPLFIQTVSGGSASDTGEMIMPLSVSIVVSSFLGGRLVSRVSYRTAMLVSNALIVLSMTLFCMLDAGTSHMVISLDMILLGLGIGLSFPVIYNVSLSRVEPSQWGTVNALIPFFRSVGGVMGVSLLGSIQASRFRHELESLQGSIMMPDNKGDINAWLGHMGRPVSADGRLNAVASELMHSIVFVFDWTLAIALVPLLASLWLGRARLMPYRGMPPEGHFEYSEHPDRPAYPESSEIRQYAEFAGSPNEASKKHPAKKVESGA